MGLWMQKNREVFPHSGEAIVDHLLGRRTHYDIVTIFHRQAEQRVPYRTTDDISLETRHAPARR